jgi:hypothetical protein
LLAKEVDGVVIVPDIFEGQAADISWLPMDTEEKILDYESFRCLLRKHIG